MSRLSIAQRHDPYWDLDGKGARRSRHQRQFVRWAFRLVVVLATQLVMVLTAVILAMFRPGGRTPWACPSTR